MSRPAHGTYAFLHARLGALRAELLGPRIWEALLQARSFAEQSHVLAMTCYARYLVGTASATVVRLRVALSQAARCVQRSLRRPAAQFIRVWGERDLLSNLKTILRGKALGRSEAAITAELLDLGPATQRLHDHLLSSRGVEEALDLLEATELRRWIREVRRVYRRDPSLFGLDATLDRVWYVMVWDRLQDLPPADREGVTDLVALEVDQVNLLWLLRYRLNYQLSPAESYYLLAPVTGLLDAEQLKQLVQQDSLAAMVTQLQVEPFRSLLESCTSLWQVEAALWRLRARQARRILRREAFTLGEALAFLELKAMEGRDLLALVEGVRLGVTPEDIRSQLALGAT